MLDSVTVGVVAHNEEQRISKCLESLVHLQKHIRDMRVIVVDNASTDQTVAVAEKVLQRKDFSYLIVKRNENHLAQARNDILERSTTRWIYMFDADCQLDESTWTQLVDRWNDNPKIAARGGSQKFFLAPEILLLLDAMRKSYWGHFGSAQMRSSETDAKFLEHVSTTHVLYDREALQSVGGFHSALRSSAEDLELSLRLRRNDYLLQFIPQSFLWHEQVQTWRQWAQKAFRNGVWQTRLIVYNPGILKTRRPWPGIFLFLIPLVPFPILLLGFLSYLVTVLILAGVSELVGVQKLKLWGLYIVTHALYAVGEMVGVVLALRDIILKMKLPISTHD